MTRNIKFALFYMFIFGFCVSNALGMLLVTNAATSKILIMLGFGVIMLVTAINYYRDFAREYNSTLSPTRNGWKK